MDGAELQWLSLGILLPLQGPAGSTRRHQGLGGFAVAQEHGPDLLALGKCFFRSSFEARLASMEQTPHELWSLCSWSAVSDAR